MKKGEKIFLFVAMIIVLMLMVFGSGCVGYVGPDGKMQRVGIHIPPPDRVVYRHEKTVTTRVWGPGGGVYYWDNQPQRVRTSRCPACGVTYRYGTRHSCRRNDYNYGNRNHRPDVHIHYHDDGGSRNYYGR